jgi:hypothetical protein
MMVYDHMNDFHSKQATYKVVAAAAAVNINEIILFGKSQSRKVSDEIYQS